MTNKLFSFVMGGYECNGALAKNKRYNDLKSTKHITQCRKDYKLLKDIGIYTVREGLLWHKIDKGIGKYDFSVYEKMMKIGKQENIQQIWDLNHFDYPEYLNPFSQKFVTNFAKYAVECVKLIRQYQKGTIFIVPFNEISFFTYMGGSVGAWAPFSKTKGDKLKIQCVKAVILAINEIKKIENDIRFINVEPIMRRIPFNENIITKSMEYTFEGITFETFDMLSGIKKPELGGSLKHLDIIGINHYPTSQEWLHYDANFKLTSQEMINFKQTGWVPLVQFLIKIVSRYGSPILISETGAWGNLRKDWWKEIFKQIDKALKLKINLLGVCAYPIIDRQDWGDGHLTNSGFWDFKKGDKHCKRYPYNPVIKVISEYIKTYNTKNIKSNSKYFRSFSKISIK